MEPVIMKDSMAVHIYGSEDMDSPQYHQSYYDDIRIKDKVKDKLLNNQYILHSLNYTAGKLVEPYDYYGNVILPYYLTPSTQTNKKNYICYETSFTEMPRYNEILKYQQVIFYILCNCAKGNIIDSETEIARHDLIGSLIIEEFNWTNDLGFQVHLLSDQSRPVDNEFCARTIVFQQTTPDCIIKDGRVVNNK